MSPDSRMFFLPLFRFPFILNSLFRYRPGGVILFLCALFPFLLPWRLPVKLKSFLFYLVLLSFDRFIN